MRKLKHKTAARFLMVYILAQDLNRRPTAYEVMQRLDCSRSCAYNYLSSLEWFYGQIQA